MNMSEADLRGDWNYPTSIKMGCGRISELPSVCQSLQIESPLLVTDAGLAQSDIVQNAISVNSAAGIRTALFADVKANPNGANVEAGVAQYRQGQHDAVIAFGGGSALDAGKAIALMSGQSQSIWAFEDVADNWTRIDEDGIAPIIAIPTTSGTGSEVGRAAVIVDEARHIKRIIFHPRMLPKMVIADPALTVGLPPHITAATGMDALAHNLEAYCVPGYHPMADGISIEAIRLIRDNLLLAFNEPDNLVARSHMMVASSMGATAFQKGLGAMHALAHPLGALYDAHHGLLNAVVMPYVLARNRSAIEDKMRYLAICLQLDDVSFEGVLSFITDLRLKLGIPDDLRAIGIDDQQVELVGKMASVDPSASGNPIALTEQDYAELFRLCLAGSV